MVSRAALRNAAMANGASSQQVNTNNPRNMVHGHTNTETLSLFSCLHQRCNKIGRSNGK
eukprot:CAMPEP_0115878676 /NCGR_PEP_ID=MMETSP0287-20121206/26901_1 /TAXON_ID=412157 /ORGANISM="Chrysochromulina rotalis, Strain UIO044" /LENGTH=58 /DNA_ID=CAMNT_0003334309 /DNA_START=275 /DNA_END=451 /DNA_ORIENTATION=+